MDEGDLSRLSDSLLFYRMLFELICNSHCQESGSMPGNGSVAITAGSPSVGLADFATQCFRQFTKESLEVNLQPKAVTLLSAAS